MNVPVDGGRQAPACCRRAEPGDSIGSVRAWRPGHRPDRLLGLRFERRQLQADRLHDQRGQRRMSKTASERELLQACIQDLYAGRRLAAERLGCVAGQATTELAAAIESLRHDYAQEAEQLDETGLAQGGPDNVWMAGILDDADRDTRSVKQGKLLDTALIGAVRKAVAADGVSLETAVASPARSAMRTCKSWQRLCASAAWWPTRPCAICLSKRLEGSARISFAPLTRR